MPYTLRSDVSHRRNAMIRDTSLNVRLTANERQLAEAVAERLERNGSDLVRYLLRKEARALGVMPDASPEKDRHVAQAAGAI
jgi:hypothetical protein